MTVTPALSALFPLPALVIMGTAFAVVAPFLYLGNPSGHDFEFHLLSWMEVVAQWKQGILFPRWAAWAHWTYGEARFLFYPPISWKLGAILGALLPWKMAPGVFVWVALVASGCSMFLLARNWLERKDAIFAAALYAANPYYFVVVYWRSALAELLAGCLLPLLLLFILRAEDDGRQSVVPLGMLVAAAWLTNVPSAVMVTYSLALLLLVVAVLRRRPRVLLYGGAAVVLGAALAGFYLIPAMYEQKWVRIGEVLSPGLRPQDNFLFSRTQDADHDQFNLLVSAAGSAEVAVLAVAIYLSRKWRQLYPAVWWTFSAWAIASALLMLPITLLLWRLPEMRFVQFPWRWLLCLNVGLAFLVTVACRRWVSRLLLCAAMLGVVFGVWHRVQAPWWDTAADVHELHDFIADGDGYEGTDEYVPAGVDPAELNKKAPRVAVAGRGSANIRILEWGPQSRRFTAEVPRSESLRLRLFNYPAWQVKVNGVAIAAKSQPVTGEILVPVEPGISEVRVRFVQTRDRFLGGLVSLLALFFVVGCGIYGKRRNRLQH